MTNATLERLPKYTAFRAPTSGEILIYRVNTLAYKESRTVAAISAELGIHPDTVEDVIKQRYVKDVEHLFKADEDITLEEYNEIHERYVPGKQSPCNQYRLARELLIHPDTVVSIAGRRFSNAHTHPSRYAEPETAETVERRTERRMDADDVARVNKLLGFGWPVADIASDLQVDASRILKVKQAKLNNWPVSDVLGLVNKEVA